LQRAATRQQNQGSGGIKDDIAVIVSSSEPPKGDRKAAKDAKTGSANKEELFQEPIPEPNSTTAASNQTDFPAEFARLMEEKIVLDEGALRRIWQEAHAIVPDATTEEICHFFNERAVAVYRNRKLDNPTGLMLSSMRDWFPQRRVVERRRMLEDDANRTSDIREQLAKQLANLELNR
jgi:hypothetical protein